MKKKMKSKATAKCNASPGLKFKSNIPLGIIANKMGEEAS
jgi:hypothetical protein